MILSHDMWRGRFGASDDILGRTLELDEQNYRVIGVMPRRFGFPSIASPPEPTPAP